MDQFQKEVDLQEEIYLQQETKRQERNSVTSIFPFLCVCGANAITASSYEEHNVTHLLNAAGEINPKMIHNPKTGSWKKSETK